MSELILNKTTNPGTPATGKAGYWTNQTDGQLWYTSDAGATWPVGHFPKDIEGVVYIDTANTQGWSGSDVGGWINSAYAYLQATYASAVNGGIIELAPGSYNFSTPIVCAQVGFSVWIRGKGDGNGATILNWTTASGTALTIAGASGNDGGVQLSDFTITGTAQGNGATAISLGTTTGPVYTAGATIKNVSIRRFTTGINWANSAGVGSYAAELWNCKVQQCTTGLAPFGEDNVIFGGLIGNNASGIVPAGASCEINMFGTAFDDNTTTAVNLSNNSQRMTDCGCRYENAALGTSNYITISAGSYAKLGGAFQEDNTTGTATGFIQATGGIVSVKNVWVYSGGRVMTQIYNIANPTDWSEHDTMISPGSSSPSTTLGTLVPSAYRGSIIATPAGFTTAETVIVQIPIPLNTLLIGTTYEVKCFATIGTATAGTVTGRLRFGTAGTTADAQIASVVDAATTTASQVFHIGTVTVRTLGATGSLMATFFQAAAAVVTNNSTAPTATTVNTTVSNWLTFTLQGGGTVSPTITVTNAYIELIRPN